MNQPKIINTDLQEQYSLVRCNSNACAIGGYSIPLKQWQNQLIYDSFYYEIENSTGTKEADFIIKQLLKEK